MMTDYISKTTVKKMLASDTPLLESGQNKHAVNNLSRLEVLQELLDLGARVKFIGTLGETKIPSDVLVEDSYFYRLGTGEWRAKNGYKWYRSKSPKDFLERFVWTSNVYQATKECVRCQTIKPTQEFNKNSSSKDGFQSYCRSCSKEYNRRYRGVIEEPAIEPEVLPEPESDFDTTNKSWYTLEEVAKALKIQKQSVRKRKQREDWQQRINQYTKRSEVYVDLDQLIARKPSLNEEEPALEAQPSGDSLPLEVELATLRERNLHLSDKVQEQKDYISKLEKHIDSLETPDKPKGFFRRVFK